MWVYYTAALINQLGWNLTLYFLCHGCNNTVLHSFSIHFEHFKVKLCALPNVDSNCFLARLNPYKLVYTVTKFARQYSVPIRQSAFTGNYHKADVSSAAFIFLMDTLAHAKHKEVIDRMFSVWYYGNDVMFTKILWFFFFHNVFQSSPTYSSTKHYMSLFVPRVHFQ